MVLIVTTVLVTMSVDTCSAFVTYCNTNNVVINNTVTTFTLIIPVFNAALVNIGILMKVLCV